MSIKSYWFAMIAAFAPETVPMGFSWAIAARERSKSTKESANCLSFNIFPSFQGKLIDWIAKSIKLKKNPQLLYNHIIVITKFKNFLNLKNKNYNL